MSVKRYSDMSFREKSMKSVSAVFKKLMKDESGQGATEYVLLVVVVVALVMLFRDRIYSALSDKLGTLANDIGSFTGQGGGN